MRDYDFKLTGTRPYILEAQGSRFFYKTGAESGGLTGIIVSAERGGLELMLMPGEGVRLPTSPGRWMIRKAEPTALDLTGRFIVGDADFTASRVQGDMNILNLSALQSGPGSVAEQTGIVRRFRASTTMGAVNHGHHMLHRLRNPAGNNRLFVVSCVHASRTSPPAEPERTINWNIGVRVEPTNLGTLQPSSHNPVTEGSVSNSGFSSAHLSYDQDNGSDGVTVPKHAFAIGRDLLSVRIIDTRNPVVLAPGFALTIAAMNNLALEGVCVHWVWTETLL